jgi:hypothetical protein
MDESVLRGALALYDWTRQDDNGKRIAAIARVWLTEENLVQCARSCATSISTSLSMPQHLPVPATWCSSGTC